MSAVSKQAKQSEIQMRRLHWQQRRGTLELDLRLSYFFEQYATTLKEDELMRTMYEQLLAEDDGNLYRLICEDQQIPDKFQTIVGLIRQSAVSTSHKSKVKT